VTLARLGRDARLGLAANDWVELVDDRYTLGQRAYPLLQVIAIDPANSSVTLNVPKNVTPWRPSIDPRKHPLLRRWDQVDAVSTQGVLALDEGGPIELEDGIQITFEPGGVYAAGEYWLIPARVAGNGQIDWPLATAADGTASAAALPPRGRHHYAALGVTGDQAGYQECCCRFESLCALMQADAGKIPPGGMQLVMKPQVPVTKAASATTKKTGKGAAAKTASSAKKDGPE